MATDPGHISVLLHKSIEMLDIHPGDIFLDGTLGSGGHSEEVLKQFGNQVQIIGLDMDADALDRSKSRLDSYNGNVTFVQANFRNLDSVLDTLHITNVTKILLDIGLSSNQFETSGRGFSFKKDEPLKMTFKKDPEESDITAETIVNQWEEDTLTTILTGYGEERYARRIAEEIVKARLRKPITTTFELVDIVLAATPPAYHHRKIHAATKTFQSLRIAVNDELQALEEGLRKGFERLAPEGRMAVIAFHSLEDRIVKRFFREKQMEEVADLLTKRPLVPTDEEVELNRRARSAKLRVLVKK